MDTLTGCNFANSIEKRTNGYLNKTLKYFLSPKYCTIFICFLGHLSRNYFRIMQNTTNQVLSSKVVVGKPKGISNP